MPVSPDVHYRLNRLSTMMTGIKSPAPVYSPVRKAGLSSMANHRCKPRTRKKSRQFRIEKGELQKQALPLPVLSVGVGSVLCLTESSWLAFF